MVRFIFFVLLKASGSGIDSTELAGIIRHILLATGNRTNSNYSQSLAKVTDLGARFFVWGPQMTIKRS